MAEIAAAVEQALAERAINGRPGATTGRILASGGGWTVGDVVCSSDRRDKPFQERHSNYAIAIVVAGTFQYRSAPGEELMTPGSLMLGSAGWGFECGHEHGAGDRCVSFSYDPDYFERLAADAGVGGARLDFGHVRVPPIRETSSIVARAAAGALGADDVPWEELALDLAARTLQLTRPTTRRGGVPPGAAARVTRAVRRVERHPNEPLRLATLAREAGLSPYHFLRTFERLTGTTPHQYVRRARLRAAAARIASERVHIIDAALDSGFGDVSNFNRAFRAEFGASPRAFRRAARGR